MLYLSDQLYVSKNFESNGIGTYIPYEVYLRPSGEVISTAAEHPWDMVYRGHIYVTGGYQKIWLNDIIASYMNDFSFIEPNPTINQYDGSIEGEVIDGVISPYVFMVDVKVNYPSLGTTQFLSQILRYYRDVNTPRGENIPDISRIDQGSERIYNILNQRTNVIPRIPRVNSYRFWLGALIIPNSTAIYISYNGDPYIRWVGLDGDKPAGDYNDVNMLSIECESNLLGVNVTGDSLYELLTEYYNATEIGIATMIGVDGDKFLCYTPVAKVDDCASKYYLIWMDRTGAYQCQPFALKTKITENITNVDIMNMNGEIRPIQKDINSQFELNSDWLTEDEYKAFESIFVSPYLYLYDTELDEGYWVNVTNKSWVEKTARNEMKPFNLSVTVETNKTQNIHY